MFELSVRDQRIRNIEAAAKSSNLELERLRSAVDHATDYARASAASLGRSEETLYQLQTTVAAVVAVQTEALPQVLYEVRRQGVLLADIQTLLANPSGTAAQERLRRGESLYFRELFPEAESEFRISLDFDAYHPLTHYRLGQVQASIERYAEAGESFTRAARYGTDPSFWAGAALSAAAAFGRAQLYDRQLELLDWAGQAIPDCPEVWLALAARQRPGALRRALSIAPELVVDAMASRMDELPSACEAVLADGVYDRARNNTEVLNRIAEFYDRHGIEHDLEPAALPPPPEMPDARLCWCLTVAERSRQVLDDAPARAAAARAITPIPALPTGNKPEPPTFGSLFARLGIGIVVAWLALIAISVPITAGKSDPDPGPVIAIGIVLLVCAILWAFFSWSAKIASHSQYVAEEEARAAAIRARDERAANLEGEISGLVREFQHEPSLTRTVPLFA